MPETNGKREIGRLLVIGGAEDPDEKDMTILPHPQKHPVDDRLAGSVQRRDSQQFIRCRCGGLRRFVLSANTMDVRGLDLQRLQQKFACNAIVAVGVARRNAPFVRPEKMRLTDPFVLVRASRNFPEEIVGYSAP